MTKEQLTELHKMYGQISIVETQLLKFIYQVSGVPFIVPISEMGKSPHEQGAYISRPRMVHRLKCVDPYFTDIVYQRKKFDLRKNDRGFVVGDVITFTQYDPKTNQFGSSIAAVITYILSDESFGLQPGYVVLGISLTP